MKYLRFVLATFGFYRADRVFVDYDCVIDNSFGTTTDEGSINADLRKTGEMWAVAGRPLIMDQMLTNSFSRSGRRPDHNVEGEISTPTGKNTGTIGVLVSAQRYMDEHGLKRPLIVGHACHVHRIAMQARMLGMNPILPPRKLMPRQFDSDSKQIWTKNIVLWFAHEIIGAPVLVRRNQLTFKNAASTIHHPAA